MTHPADNTSRVGDPARPQQIVESKLKILNLSCLECGTPLVWAEYWQGADCVICTRKDRDQRDNQLEADLRKEYQEKAEVAILDLRRQLQEAKAFVDRCHELGASDTDDVKHALEDQARIRTELAPLSIELTTLRQGRARLRELITEQRDAAARLRREAATYSLNVRKRYELVAQAQGYEACADALEGVTGGCAGAGA